MRTFQLRVGIERIDDTPMVCVGLKTTSTKPPSETIRKAVTIAIAVVGFALAIHAMNATDAEAHPQQTINLTSITR